MKDLIPAAQYLQMSSDQPKSSFPYQTAGLRTIQRRFGFMVVKSYEAQAVSGLKLKPRQGPGPLSSVEAHCWTIV